MIECLLGATFGFIVGLWLGSEIMYRAAVKAFKRKPVETRP